jgi:hypothetical protein
MAVDPVSGDWQGGTDVRITGSDFPAGARVFFGASEATVTSVSGPGDEILCTTARHGPPGVVDVRVVDPVDGAMGELSGGFEYLGPKAPAVFAIDPSEGSEDGGTAVTITGDYFELTPEVYFGKELTGTVTFDATTNVIGSGTLFWGADHLPATGDEEVVAGDYVSMLSDGRWVSVQTVVSETQLTLSAAYPTSGAGVAAGVGRPMVGTTVLMESTQLTGTVDLTMGSLQVDGSGTKFLSEVHPGDFIRVDAGSWMKVASVTDDVTLTLDAGEAVAATVSGTGYVSPDEKLTGTTPPMPLGVYDVWVLNPSELSGRALGIYAYKLNPCTVTSVTPGIGPYLGGTPVAILGTNMDLTPLPLVKFGDGFATNVSVVDNGDGTQTVSCTTPRGASWTRVDVAVVKANALPGLWSEQYAYTGRPSIANVTPAAGPEAGGTAVTIAGTYFWSDGWYSPSKPRVWFDGVEVDAADVTLPVQPDPLCTELYAVTPPGTPGFAVVRVMNPDGFEDTAGSVFQYLPPPVTVSLVSPGAAPAGATVWVLEVWCRR